MDRLDRKILDVLQKRDGISTTDVANEVGLSHTACWRRMKKLESAGAIRERTVILDARAIGLPVSVLAEVRLREHDAETVDGFERLVDQHPQIVECFSMSGDRDYQLRVVARDVEQYERFLRKVLLNHPGVSSISSNFALRTIKLTTRLPLNGEPAEWDVSDSR
jgi:Lrp/AsnC family transcriptional regulator